MKKRGISPLIATVLIIGFTIVVGSLILIWGGELLEKIKGETEIDAMGKLTCATKVKINIKDSCILGDEVKLKIENRGDKEVNGFLFRTFGDIGMSKSEMDSKLSPFSVLNYNAEFNANSLIGVINPNKIEVFPKILIENQEFYCDSISREVKPCYKLPSLLNLEDWEIEEASNVNTGFLEDLDIEGVEGDGLGIISINAPYSVKAKSSSFIIPDGVDNFHMRGSVNKGDIKYSLIYNNEERIISEKSNVIIELSPTISIKDLAGKSVYLLIEFDGDDVAEYVTLTELCYTNKNYCVI